MTDDPKTDPDAERRRDTRRALIFGVVMATIQMAAILYFVFR